MFQLGQGQRVSHGGKIQRLAAGHALGTAGLSERAQHGYDRGRINCAAVVICEQLERQRLQGIAGEYGHRFAENDMASRLAAAQRVVIHRWQVVVNQRVRVDQLHGACCRIELATIVAECMRGGVHQQWAQTLATTQHGIAHRAMQIDGGLCGRRQALIQCLFGTDD